MMLTTEERQEALVAMLKVVCATHAFSITTMRDLANQAKDQFAAHEVVEHHIRHLDNLAPGVHALTHVEDSDVWRAQAIAALKRVHGDQRARLWRHIARTAPHIERDGENYVTTVSTLNADGIYSYKAVTSRDPLLDNEAMLQVARVI